MYVWSNFKLKYSKKRCIAIYSGSAKYSHYDQIKISYENVFCFLFYVSEIFYEGSIFPDGISIFCRVKKHCAVQHTREFLR